jgi:hypothetical protein
MFPFVHGSQRRIESAHTKARGVATAWKSSP